MTPNHFLSPAEHRIFAGISLLLCCLIFVNLSSRAIDSYNEAVEKQQIEKATGNKGPSFAVCTFGGPPFYETLLELRLITIPAMFILSLLLRLKNKIENSIIFALYLLLTTLNLFAYLSGFYDFLANAKYDGIIYIGTDPFTKYFFLEIGLFALIFALMSLQIFVLLRYFSNKRISLS